MSVNDDDDDGAKGNSGGPRGWQRVLGWLLVAAAKGKFDIR